MGCHIDIHLSSNVSLSLGIGLIFWVIRSMTRNLNKVTHVMTSVNNSNVDDLPRIEVSSKDEFGAIAVAFNKMVSELESHSQLEKNY